MPDEFTGDPTPLTNQDYERAARSIGCTVAAIRAVAQVESAGNGFLADGRPKILFERHIFFRESGRKFSDTHPHISWPKGGGYLGGAKEYDRLHEAIGLDRKAALRSVSWGKFQVMGFNHALVGFPDLEDFVKKMVSGEPAQLDAFLGFIKANGLADELIRRDWAGFARGYNGEGYRKFKYDTKMADAYAHHADGGSRTDNPTPLLRIGDRGQAVAHLQEVLGLAADGDFGPATKAAVAAFQEKHGLHPDGVVGQQTWDKLLTGAGGAAEPAHARPPLRQGERGDDVKYLQELLGVPADGVFGGGTQQAVIAFQQQHGLTADGIVGAKTWETLLAGRG